MVNQKRLATPLRDLVFFRELPFLLGISYNYARQMAKPPQGEKYAYFRDRALPRPIMVSKGGIRVWRRQDLELWLLSARRKGIFGAKHGVPMLDDREMADKLLGRS